MSATVRDARRVFLKKGTCSQALCFLLDREFGHLKPDEERAADPLAGGLLQQGQQCGMLWGAALAAGAESFRRHTDRDQAIGAAMTATRRLVDSFAGMARSVNCRDIIGCDFSGRFGLWKALLLGRFIRCFQLEARWAPEAIRAAREGLDGARADASATWVSCASEVAKKMGAGDEEIVMVAGFAGGIGLSGHACGALGAAVWVTVLELVRKSDWKYSLSDPVAGGIIQKFREATGAEMACRKITGKRFHTTAEHAAFIKGGGCAGLIDLLART